MAPPKFELTFSEDSSEESVHNFHILEERFPQLSGERGLPIIEGPELGEEYFEIANSQNEELYIYPQKESWYFRKTQDMRDGKCILFDSVMLVPYQTTEFKTKIAMISLSTSDIIDIEGQMNDKGSKYYYGKLDRVMAENNRGVYYKDVEEYNEARSFIERNTGVTIGDFHIGLDYYRELGQIGEITIGDIQIAMELE